MKAIIEKMAFDFFSFLGEWMGIASSQIRLFFIYITFVAVTSPLIISFVLYFWLNINKYILRSRTSIWEL